MALLPILEFPDPRLRTRAEPVEHVDAALRKLIDDMFETMYAAPGIGLAATQVNVHKRLLVIDVSEKRNERLALINPEILAREGIEETEEGCLSVPGIYDKVTGIWGWDFNAAYGLDAFGNGRYYVGETKGVTQKGVTKYQGGLNLYRWTGDVPAPFTRVTADAAE